MLEIGQVLHDRYQLQRQLGHNAARQTWLATDLRAIDSENHEVVVKLLAVGGQVQWDDLKLFEREAQVLQQLDHPRIPQYHDYFSIDDKSLWFGLVQEYIPGASLRQLLDEGRRFDEDEVRQIAVNLLHILTYLHELSPTVLHRDIKPSNLMLGEDDYIYLVDFGAVQSKTAAEGATFTVVGTYGYAPMEQFGGRAVPASDLYALGATLIHLVTGTAPADLPQEDLRIQFSHLVSLSPDLVRWLEQLTEPSPNRRFSTADGALEALKIGSTLMPVRGMQQPVHSRVQISRSSQELVIQIPGPKWTSAKTKWTSAKTFWLGALILFMVSTLVQFPFLAVLLMISSPILFWMVLELIHNFSQGYRVIFNRRNFTLEQCSFGFYFGRREGHTSAILDVFQSVTEVRKRGLVVVGTIFIEKEMVTIQTAQHQHSRYSFGMGLLSAIECHWLAQEIKSWLGLK